MNLIFAPQAWTDYLYWQTTDPKMLRRVNELIRDTSRSPFEGIGKPEALRHALQGFWSRRISEEHRMVYRVTEHGLEIAQLRYHYSG
jgi:toxin YoeB